MKRILTVAVLASCGIVLTTQSVVITKSAPKASKTKYICGLNLPDEEYTTEFATLEECRKYCDVCEKTEAQTVVPTDFDE